MKYIVLDRVVPCKISIALTALVNNADSRLKFNYIKQIKHLGYKVAFMPSISMWCSMR